MSTQEHSITVKVLDKAYQVKCPADMVQELQNAAVYVDQKMREIRDGGKVVGLDRIAIIAALNIAFEFLNTQQKDNKSIDIMSERIHELQKRVEETLTQYEQMEL